MQIGVHSSRLDDSDEIRFLIITKSFQNSNAQQNTHYTWCGTHITWNLPHANNTAITSPPPRPLFIPSEPWVSDPTKLKHKHKHTYYTDISPVALIRQVCSCRTFRYHTHTYTHTGFASISWSMFFLSSIHFRGVCECVDVYGDRWSVVSCWWPMMMSVFIWSVVVVVVVVVLVSCVDVVVVTIAKAFS